MHDDKRRLRRLKREIKKQGNRKRRRFFKDVTKSADQFEFGLDSSGFLNEQTREQDRSTSD